MHRFEAATRKLSDLGGALAATAVIFITAHTLVEIVLRTVFGLSTYVLVEFAGYALAVIAFLGLGRTLLDGAMISVNLVRDRLPQPIVVILEIASILTTAALMLFIGYQFAAAALKFFRRGTVSETMAEFPAWILPTVIAIGCVLFTVQLAAYLTRVVRTRRTITGSVAADGPV